MGSQEQQRGSLLTVGGTTPESMWRSSRRPGGARARGSAVNIAGSVELAARPRARQPSGLRLICPARLAGGRRRQAHRCEPEARRAALRCSAAATVGVQWPPSGGDERARASSSAIPAAAECSHRRPAIGQLAHARIRDYCAPCPIIVTDSCVAECMLCPLAFIRCGNASGSLGAFDRPDRAGSRHRAA